MRTTAWLIAIALPVAGCSGDDPNGPNDSGGAVDSSVLLDTGSGLDAGLDGTADGAPPIDATTCPTLTFNDLAESKRASCTFKKGAKVGDSLSLTAAQRAAIPIKHLVIVTQENRSFDHYFGRLPQAGKADLEGLPSNYTNPDKDGTQVKSYPLASGCLPADPPHQGTAMKAGWNGGKMDGFVKSAATTTNDGHYVMGYYEQVDLPFYYFLAQTFAVSDHYFGSSLGGTWANRDYLYAGTSDGVTATGEKTISVPTIYDAMDAAKITWGVYTDGSARQDCLGWKSSHAGLHKFSTFTAALKNGTLPQVSYVDPGGDSQDEHPPNDIHGGENWGHSLYGAALASPLWSKMAIVYTYDESGGLADHLPPPKACIPSADQTDFDRLGIRVPMILISPWARPGYVSHTTHDHTSTLRLIEALFDLPALTARDANADALFDMFNFNGCAALLKPPTPPAAGKMGCP